MKYGDGCESNAKLETSNLGCRLSRPLIEKNFFVSDSCRISWKGLEQSQTYWIV
jgi:hypothetical protein